MSRPADPNVPEFSPYWIELINEVKALRTANENHTTRLDNIHQAIVESELQHQEDRKKNCQDIEALWANHALAINV